MITLDLERFLSSENDFDPELVAENPAQSFSELLNFYLAQRGMKRSKLIIAMNIDRNYGYQILNGTRIPTRNQIIKIAVFLGLEVADLQRLLRICCREGLYVREMLDARVYYALEHKMPYAEACDFIWKAE